VEGGAQGPEGKAAPPLAPAFLRGFATVDAARRGKSRINATINWRVTAPARWQDEYASRLGRKKKMSMKEPN